MSAVIAPVEQLTRPTRRERKAERRRLKQVDQLSTRLAELHAIRSLLDQAADVVRHGWVQGAWFTVATPGGDHAVTAYDLSMVTDHPVTGACLVGAVVQAAGGPATVATQLVQRTLDLTWHALREDSERPVQWCPGPRARLIGVLDLTHWNDAPGRTQDEVVDLLVGAQRTVDAQQEMCRTKLTELSAPPELTPAT